MQEELFKANSKDNMRYLKENDNIEKFKIMDSEKKSLNRELIELKGTVEQLQDELKLLQNENDILQEQVSEVRLPTWPGVTKIDPLVSKLQTEMDELREENDRLRCSTSAFRISSEI
jgi:FtsZ-binding cell division protein ZapB